MKEKVYEEVQGGPHYCSADSEAPAAVVGADGGCALRTTKLACWLQKRKRGDKVNKSVEGYSKQVNALTAEGVATVCL